MDNMMDDIDKKTDYEREDPSTRLLFRCSFCVTLESQLGSVTDSVPAIVFLEARLRRAPAA